MSVRIDVPMGTCGAKRRRQQHVRTLDGERGGADTIEDPSGDRNETGDTTASGRSGLRYIPRRNRS